MGTLVTKRTAVVGSAALVPLALVAVAAGTRDATLLAWGGLAGVGWALVARYA